MSIKKIKAAVTGARHAIISCEDFDDVCASVDFEVIEKQKASKNFGIQCWGAPALSIDRNVATIKVRGLLAPKVGVDVSEWGLTGYDVIEHYIDYANNDKGVDRIVLDFDSGGGYVSGVRQCAEAIKSSKKDVESFVSGGAYSAAYWLACSATKVTAQEGAGVGSIGSFIKYYEVSEKYEKQGISLKVFKNMPWKNAFSGEQPLTKEEDAYLKESVDETDSDFFAHVSNQRDIGLAKIPKLKGKSFDAKKAMEIGLIDSIREDSTGLTGKNEAKAGENEEMTEEEKNKIREEARADVLAEFKAKEERAKEVLALDGNNDVKSVLAQDAFAGVAVEAMKELLATVPKGFVEIQDESGEPLVATSPRNFAEQTKDEAEKEAKETAEAAEKIKQTDMEPF